MKKSLKKRSILLLLVVALMALTSITASAASVKTVKKQKFTTKKSVAYKKAITIKTGTTKLRAQQGFVRFVAPKAGKYKFTFSGMLPYKSTSSSRLNSGYWYIMTTYGTKNQYIGQVQVPTKAGKSSALWVATKARYNEIDKGNKITTSTCLPTRSGTIKLEKKQPVYLYFNLGYDEWFAFNMTIKRK